MPSRGLVEFLDRASVRGWAYAADRADVHLQIKVTLDGELVARGTADIARDDLVRAGIGAGDHAFDISFDRAISPTAVPQLEVTAFAEDMEEFRLNVLPPSASDLELPPAAPPRPCRLDKFPLPSSDGSQHPVFVLGAARSGTSAIAQGLLKCGEYQGFEEGHLLWMLQRFLDTIRAFYAFNGEDALPSRFTMLSHAPFTYMVDAVRAAFVAAAAEMFPTGKWIDKTPRPEMIAAARLMRELWPNARFIFMRRRGIENVLSRLLKFPQISFDDHCHDWANSMMMWLRVRDLLGTAVLEVEQLALARSPDHVASQIGAFLGIPDRAIDRLASSFSLDLPERTSDVRSSSPIDVSETGWSVAQLTSFRTICGPMMAAFGYSYTREYFGTLPACVSI